MLVEDYGSRLDDDGRRICSVISDSAKEMGRLIDDLLAFSRVGPSDPETIIGGHGDVGQLHLL